MSDESAYLPPSLTLQSDYLTTQNNKELGRGQILFANTGFFYLLAPVAAQHFYFFSEITSLLYLAVSIDLLQILDNLSKTVFLWFKVIVFSIF